MTAHFLRDELALINRALMDGDNAAASYRLLRLLAEADAEAEAEDTYHNTKQQPEVIAA